MKKKLIASLFIILLSSSLIYSQKTSIQLNPEKMFRTGLDLYKKEKFASAQDCFNKIIYSVDDVQSELRVNSEYYQALCAIQLFNEDAEYLMTNFIEKHPESLLTRNAYFQLGKYQYYKKKYSEALNWFKQVDVFDLNKEDLSEYKFKLGYMYFMEKDYEKAKKSFFEIKDFNTKFSKPANYYYAHIAYNEKNYETAIKIFTKLLNDETFGTLVPYYITHIYYLNEKYDDLIKFAPQLLDSSTTKRAPEIARLIGEAYYKTNKYSEAVKYLKIYQEKTSNKVSREDNYQLGFSYYKSGDYVNAIKALENISTNKDSLSQNIFYILADCYLKNDQKQFARNAFLSAYKNNIDSVVTENSLFNYAKISYEISMNPYNEATNSFQIYIKNYPKSPKVEEAYKYLVDMFFTTKNYKDALESIEKINLKNVKLKQAHQKIAYCRGIELFNNEQYNEALALFNKSLKYPENNDIESECYYWKGESYYRLNNLDSALIMYNTFLLTQGAFSLPIYNSAHYNIAYCYFKEKDYQSAILSFRKYIANPDKEDPKKVNDAMTRIADCYFISKDYANALDYYEKSIQLKALDQDYALFQKSVVLGVLGNFESKITTLLELNEKFPKSAYTDDAIYELANTYMIQGSNDKALTNFKNVINNYPSSSYVKKSLQKVGLIQYNSNQDEQALATFKSICTNYPGSQEAKEALVSIRNIYMEMNNVDEYMSFAKQLPYGNITVSEQDSITYIAAENKYMDGDCDNSVKSFENYISKFPQGSFIVNANFYKSECNYKKGDIEAALKGYEFVVSSPQCKFTENALLKSSLISYKLKNYKKASEYYSRLENTAEFKNNIIEARTGMMRSYFMINDYSKSIESANKLINTEKVSDDLLSEAHIIKAKSSLALDSLSSAITEFETTAKVMKNELGAEATYNIAYIYYKQSNYPESEKTIFKLINQFAAYDYWKAKSFILLADNYIKTGNLFQAKATLQSIIDNYDGEDLIKIAHEKMNIVNQEQKTKDEEKLKNNKTDKNQQDTDIQGN